MHHQAASGLADVAGLRELDLPVLRAHQAVGVAVVERARAAAARGADSGAALGGVFADQRIFMRGAHEFREVGGGRDVGRRKPGRLDEAALVHVEHRGLGVHRVDESFQAAGIAVAERRCGAVLGGHEREQQQVAARDAEPAAQPRARALHADRVFLAEHDLFFEVEAAIEDHHRGHELGDRGDGHYGVGVLAEHHLAGLCILNQRDRGAQRDLANILRLREADAEEQHEDERAHGNNALERMQFSLHGGESSP